MAKLTYAVSVFTKGVLSLRSVSLGVLRVDSHRLLEDGIRQELVKKVSLALCSGLNFDQKSKVTCDKRMFFPQNRMLIKYCKTLLLDTSSAKIV